MSIGETVEKLGEYYPRDTSAIMISTLKDWCNRKNIESEIDCQIFFNIIVQNHRPKARGTFPDIAEIEEWWDGRGDTKKKVFDAVKECFNQTEDWDVKRIVKGVYYVWALDERNSTQEVFLYVWDEMGHVSSILRDRGWGEFQRIAYLEKIKTAIIAGTYTGIPYDELEVKANSITALSDGERLNQKGEKGPGMVHVGEVL